MKERLFRRVAPSLIIAIGGGLLLHNIDRGISDPISSGVDTLPNQDSNPVAGDPDVNNGSGNVPVQGSNSETTNNGGTVTNVVPTPGDTTSGGTNPTKKPNTSSQGGTTPDSSGGKTNTPATTPTPIGNDKRTILGDAQQTKYGVVQVQIVVDGNNKLVDVKAIKLPQGSSNLLYSNYAAPILREAALSAQSAQISFASGASYTSQGYIASLQSAIDKI